MKDSSQRSCQLRVFSGYIPKTRSEPQRILTIRNLCIGVRMCTNLYANGHGTYFLDYYEHLLLVWIIISKIVHRITPYFVTNNHQIITAMAGIFIIESHFQRTLFYSVYCNFNVVYRRYVVYLNILKIQAFSFWY